MDSRKHHPLVMIPGSYPPEADAGSSPVPATKKASYIKGLSQKGSLWTALYYIPFPKSTHNTPNIIDLSRIVIGR